VPVEPDLYYFVATPAFDAAAWEQFLCGDLDFVDRQARHALALLAQAPELLYSNERTILHRVCSYGGRWARLT
jgi:hypothetical protein